MKQFLNKIFTAIGSFIILMQAKIVNAVDWSSGGDLMYGVFEPQPEPSFWDKYGKLSTLSLTAIWFISGCIILFNKKLSKKKKTIILTITTLITGGIWLLYGLL